MPVKESQEPKELVEFVSDEQLKSFIEEWDRYDKDQNGSCSHACTSHNIGCAGTITVQEFLEGEKAYENALTGEEMSEEALKDKLEARAHCWLAICSLIRCCTVLESNKRRQQRW